MCNCIVDMLIYFCRFVLKHKSKVDFVMFDCIQNSLSMRFLLMRWCYNIIECQMTYVVTTHKLYRGNSFNFMCLNYFVDVWFLFSDYKPDILRFDFQNYLNYLTGGLEVLSKTASSFNSKNKSNKYLIRS